MIYYIVLIALSVGLDQWVKWWIEGNVPLYDVLGSNGVMTLTHIRNSGAAWSILEGKMWFFYIITVIALGIFSFLLYKNRFNSKWLTIGLSLIIGGTLGNFIDRVKQGFVVDMFQFEFINFPIFNIADIFLCVGVGCLFVYILFFEDKK